MQSKNEPCQKCWNERQNLSDIDIPNEGTGELAPLGVAICSTCQREIKNALGFLAYHGASLTLRPDAPAMSNGIAPEENLTAYEEVQPKVADKSKAKS